MNAPAPDTPGETGERNVMPHAVTDAFSVDDTLTDGAHAAPAIAALRASHRQHEAETPNERAMRTATAARRQADPPKRQQG